MREQLLREFYLYACLLIKSKTNFLTAVQTLPWQSDSILNSTNHAGFKNLEGRHTHIST